MPFCSCCSYSSFANLLSWSLAPFNTRKDCCRGGGAGGGEGRSREDPVLCLATCSTAEQREVASSTSGRCRNLRAGLLHQQMEMLGSGGLPMPSLPITKLTTFMSLHYLCKCFIVLSFHQFRATRPQKRFQCTTGDVP